MRWDEEGFHARHHFPPAVTLIWTKPSRFGIQKGHQLLIWRCVGYRSKTPRFVWSTAVNPPPDKPEAVLLLTALFQVLSPNLLSGRQRAWPQRNKRSHIFKWQRHRTPPLMDHIATGSKWQQRLLATIQTMELESKWEFSGNLQLRHNSVSFI